VPLTATGTAGRPLSTARSGPLSCSVATSAVRADDRTFMRTLRRRSASGIRSTAVVPSAVLATAGPQAAYGNAKSGAPTASASLSGESDGTETGVCFTWG